MTQKSESSDVPSTPDELNCKKSILNYIIPNQGDSDQD